jgi:hypothetical protein
MEVLLHTWRAQYNNDNALLTTGFIRASTKRARQSPPNRVAVARVGRHVRWDPGAQYKLIRPGIPLASEAEVDALYKGAGGGSVSEERFYLFRHVDPAHTERNPLVPVYEAAYWCSEGGYFVRAQKCHLRRAYALAGRTDAKRGGEVDAITALPYWVDRAFKKGK